LLIDSQQHAPTELKPESMKNYRLKPLYAGLSIIFNGRTNHVTWHNFTYNPDISAFGNNPDLAA
jgi:hypothetical protein